MVLSCTRLVAGHPGPNGNRGGPILPFEYGPDAGPYRDQVEVSQELVPMVIGKRGATISTMKQQTGANIYVVTGSDIVGISAHSTFVYFCFQAHGSPESWSSDTFVLK